MKWVFRIAWITVLGWCLASLSLAQENKPKQVQGMGCVERGVAPRCLLLRDLRTGKLYNLQTKTPFLVVGQGIAFTASPSESANVCMQGESVEVTGWSPQQSLQCTSQATEAGSSRGSLAPAAAVRLLTAIASR